MIGKVGPGTDGTDVGVGQIKEKKKMTQLSKNLVPGTDERSSVTVTNVAVASLLATLSPAIAAAEFNRYAAPGSRRDVAV